MIIKYGIIDDNQTAIESLKYFLRHVQVMGISLEEVFVKNDLNESSQEDEDLLNSVDLIFLDIMLKRKNSLDVIKTYQEVEPVVVITTGHDGHMLKAIRLEAFDYLMKPIDQEDFTEMLIRVRNKIDRELTRMKEWITLSNAINTNYLNEEQAKKLANIHAPILENLTQSFPNLTHLDKRLLLLLKLGFGNQEIAQHLCIEPDSVKKSKSRLKKRMELKKDQSIESVLADI
jgi:DNA-binding NarL/FixJ family response regulator